MKTVGLAHMVAVSGAHLSVVAALAGALLARARMPRVALSIMLCLFYCAYAAFTDSRHPSFARHLTAAVVVSAIWGRSPFVVACGAWGMRMRFACCVSSECAVVVIFPFSCIDFGESWRLRPSCRRGLKLHLGGGQKRCAKRVRLRQRRISPSRPLRHACFHACRSCRLWRI